MLYGLLDKIPHESQQTFIQDESKDCKPHMVLKKNLNSVFLPFITEKKKSITWSNFNEKTGRRE